MDPSAFSAQLPQVTVVMATYQQERFVAQQIESLLSQIGVHTELLIRDDGSTDATRNILQQYQKEFPDRIVLLEGPHLGAMHSFQALLQHAKGEWVALSDGDDVWLPHRCQSSLQELRLAEAIYGSETPLAVCSDAFLVDEELRFLDGKTLWSTHGTPSNWNSLEKLLVHNACCGATLLCNRALLEAALPIPEEAIWHDGWLALCAATLGKVILHQDPLILYRQHEQNAVGVRSFPERVWKQGRKELGRALERLRKSCLQAHILYERYQTRITPKKGKLLQDYAAILKGARSPGRTLFKHRCWKPTFIYRVGQILGLIWMQQQEVRIYNQWLSQAASKRA